MFNQQTKHQARSINVHINDNDRLTVNIIEKMNIILASQNIQANECIKIVSDGLIVEDIELNSQYVKKVFNGSYCFIFKNNKIHKIFIRETANITKVMQYLNELIEA